MLLVSTLVMTLSGCVSSGATSAPTASPAAPSVAASASPVAATGESNAAVWTVTTANKAGLGDYLTAELSTGEDAKTVYVFKNDKPGSGSSACDATCATTWPPLLVKDGATVEGSGLNGALAQLTRSDGSVQVTYQGLPLYFYIGDHGAGDTNGVGVSASWSAAKP